MEVTVGKVVSRLESWLGKNDRDGSHKSIIDIYNTQSKLPRGYRAKYSDPWCAITMTSVFIDCGVTPIFAECSCNKMIALLKANNMWIEDESILPNVGDLVFYDWDDKGGGDCVGQAEHVGMVVGVNENRFTVIEGNNTSNGTYGTVRKLTLTKNQRYLRGFGRPNYTSSIHKSNEEVAREVIRGKYGNGEIRKKKLRELGYDPTTIQSIVNKMLRG